MENQVQAMDDRQAELSQEKQPYTPPLLVRLGNVKQVTEGEAFAPTSDDGGFSI